MSENNFQTLLQIIYGTGMYLIYYIFQFSGEDAIPPYHLYIARVLKFLKSF